MKYSTENTRTDLPHKKCGNATGCGYWIECAHWLTLHWQRKSCNKQLLDAINNEFQDASRECRFVLFIGGHYLVYYRRLT